LGRLCHAPPLKNAKYASDINMPRQTKELNVRSKNYLFFIQRIQTFFLIFITFVTFFNVCYFFIWKVFYVNVHHWAIWAMPPPAFGPSN